MRHLLSRSLARRPTASALRGLLAAGVFGAVATTPSAHSDPDQAVLHATPCNLRQRASCEIQEDSAALLRRLKAAQRNLERLRRRTLPFGGGSQGRRCDERIGRLCYWYDEDDFWTPPPDDQRVVQRRDSFLASLDSASVAIPGDPWVAGQRVRYLVEAGRIDDAIQATANCAERDWWCAALAGYVHHHTGDFAAADSAFLSALNLMPEQQRCEWSDLSLLLEGSARSRYDDLACGEREEFERRLWLLADPFYGIPGNERRSEHFYRVVLNEMLEESASPRRMRWGNDNRELLIRFGGTIGWERQRAVGSMSVFDASVIGHHRNGGRQFVPPTKFLEDPAMITAGSWDIDPDRPATRFAIPRFVHYAPIAYQLAVFKREDSVVVVLSAGWREPLEDAAVHGEAALGLAPQGCANPTAEVNDYGRPIQIRVAREPAIASVEVWNTVDSVAGRDRFWLDLNERLPDEVGVSDLLLLTPRDSPPKSLEEAIPPALSSYEVSPGAGLGLYWEMYGGGIVPETVQYTLTVARLGKGFLRRAVEWIGIVGRREDTVRLRWSAPLSTGRSFASQAVEVQLNSSMRGEYALTLVVRRSSGEETRLQRRIVVR